MSIKQSTLEAKWSYRLAKTVLLILPWAVVAVIAITRWQAILKDYVLYAVYLVIGVIAYYVIINLIQKILLYVIFGGLEKDAKPVSGVHPQAAPAGLSALSQEDKSQIGLYISILLILGIIYYVLFIFKPSGTSLPVIQGQRGSTCVSTGCGTQWYCNGTYYEDGVQRRINGCVSRNASQVYSGWSGTCRRCP